MTAAIHRASNMTAFCRMIGGEMGIENRLGDAEDSRLDQPPRVVWVPVEESFQIRECTESAGYAAAGLVVYYEDSFEYKVHFRGLDEAACRALAAKLMAALIECQAGAPVTEITGGDFRPGSVAAEQGCLIVWRIRVWTPIVHEARADLSIKKVAANIIVDAAANTVPIKVDLL